MHIQRRRRIILYITSWLSSYCTWVILNRLDNNHLCPFMVSNHWLITVVHIFIKSSTIFFWTSTGRNGVRNRDNTKALWKLPDHHWLLPRLLGNQILLFNLWMFHGIRLVQLFPYRSRSERAALHCGKQYIQDWTKAVVSAVFLLSVTVNDSTVLLLWQCVVVAWVLVCTTSHAWIGRMFLSVFVVLLT